ncbi:MAG: VOC family protein [Actinobacteria bacterium]|nr:VOC family protein [Actinomycetota bacterium]
MTESTAATLRSSRSTAPCRAAHETLAGRGAEFLTPPLNHGQETRCFFRDPDGHLFEISVSRLIKLRSAI